MIVATHAGIGRRELSVAKRTDYRQQPAGGPGEEHGSLAPGFGRDQGRRPENAGADNDPDSNGEHVPGLERWSRSAHRRLRRSSGQARRGTVVHGHCNMSVRLPNPRFTRVAAPAQRTSRRCVPAVVGCSDELILEG